MSRVELVVGCPRYCGIEHFANLNLEKCILIVRQSLMQESHALTNLTDVSPRVNITLGRRQNYTCTTGGMAIVMGWVGLVAFSDILQSTLSILTQQDYTHMSSY